MVSRLEKEIVFQTMNEFSGNDSREYLSDKIEALKELGLNIDDKKVENAIKKYQLIQEYNRRKKHKNLEKRKLKEKVRKLLEEKIEELDNHPGIISVKAGIKPHLRYESGGLYLCSNCLKYFGVRKVFAKGFYLTEAGNGSFIKEKYHETLFYFCKKCEAIIDWTGLGIIG